MADARTKREIERQDLLGTLKQLVREIADSLDFRTDHERSEFYLCLANIISSSLVGGFRDRFEDRAHELFYKVLQPTVENFARVREEKNALFSKLLEDSMQTATGLFHGSLLRKEINDPEVVFEAKTGTAEVEGNE